MTNVDGTSELPSTMDDVDFHENYYEKQVLKLTTIASVSSVVANILISATIITYKNLRRDVTYSIILHLVLVQVFSLILDEILLWFFTYYGTPLPQYHEEFCVLFVCVRMMNALSFIVIILLLFNWYLKLYASESKYQQLVKCYKFYIASIYVVYFLSLPFLIKLCLKYDVFVTFYVAISFQVLMILFSIYMSIVSGWRTRQSTERNVGLGVSNIIVIFCSPSYILIVLVYYNLCPVFVLLFADVLATGVFPFVFLYLYKTDDNFQMYFKKLLRCQRDPLENDSVTYNLINNVDI